MKSLKRTNIKSTKKIRGVEDQSIIGLAAEVQNILASNKHQNIHIPDNVLNKKSTKKKQENKPNEECQNNPKKEENKNYQNIKQNVFETTSKKEIHDLYHFTFNNKKNIFGADHTTDDEDSSNSLFKFSFVEKTSEFSSHLNEPQDTNSKIKKRPYPYKNDSEISNLSIFTPKFKYSDNPSVNNHDNYIVYAKKIVDFSRDFPLELRKDLYNVIQKWGYYDVCFEELEPDNLSNHALSKNLIEEFFKD